ncbi:MAG: cyclic pyranopterin phosphate synthase MoaA [Candidatus Solincola sediminis]|uniref:GTP 3',8-cyclase n=1 Tax=Candidatus Solincola sediminis TaxID=1797199 RepID=A0A1F2WJE0_9ACTN|nr:MAG: cyclic pyranopterin phosphate synthase MoaA [Candidatus Solincola sediminis]OFW60362.1 MAG: cyclic pyranopterin phosphate synthase MoaA [Candidatus Solincola sediminis]
MIDPYSRTIDYLRLAVTDRCNLRCLYCMPEEGLQLLRHEDILSYEEILRLLKICIQAGISKVRLTGGEPLVRKDLDYLISQISKLQPSLDISLTTNGLLLSKQAESLAAAGLKRVNISIDSLDPDTYRRITRTGNLSQVLSGLEAAIAAGLEPVKINVVVLKHVNEELEAFVELARRLPVHVRFIEYMSPCGIFDESFYVSAEEIKQGLAEFGRLEVAEPPLGAGPARYFKLAGAKGLIGFISPISSHFCPNCNRLRLTADGKMKTCLFSPDEDDIREILRSGSEDGYVLETIKRSLERKPRDYGKGSSPGRTMSQIGG